MKYLYSIFFSLLAFTHTHAEWTYATESSTILAKTPDSLFGVYINDNVLNYVTKQELKSKSKDYVKGYFYVLLKNPPIKNEDYTDDLYVTFDKNNNIANILSEKIFQSPKNCKKAQNNLREELEKKFDLEFLWNPFDHSFLDWIGDVSFQMQCEFDDKESKFFITIETYEYFMKGS